MDRRVNISLTFDADTRKAKAELKELAQQIHNISSTPTSFLDDLDLQSATQAARELETHLGKAVNVNTGKLDISKFAQSLKDSGHDLQYFQENLGKLGDDGQKAFFQLAKNIAAADAPTLTLNKHLSSILTSLKNVATYQISTTMFRGLVGSIQSAYNYAKDLNDSLTSIAIVTGRSTDEMADFAARANDAAKALSTTTTRYTDAALIYYQQGLSDEQVKERTDVTIKMANAAGESASKISDQLTAIWNNFYEEGGPALEYYADVMTKLGAETASSTDEISEGINKFAAVAQTVGLSYEYAAAALATVTATTRESADVVGNAYKTLFARIQGLQLGETLDDGTTLNKYSSALEAVGINIFDQNNQLKEMDDILDELGSKWKLLNKDQQVALAETVAGVRQYTQLIALMDNWDYFQENLERAYTSEGSLQAQADIYANEWEAASTRVRAALEGIYDSLLDDNMFIQYNDVIASILHGVEGLVDSFGGLGGILQMVGGIALQVFAKNVPNAINSLKNTISYITGTSRTEVAEIQQQSIDALRNSRDINQSAQYELERAGLEKVSKMKRELTLRSNELSSAEIEEYQTRIRQVESQTQALADLGAQVDQANLKAKESISTFANDAIVNLAELYQQTQAQGDNWEEAWDGLVYKILPDLNKQLRDVDKIDFRAGFMQPSAEAREAYEAITQSIKDTTAELTKQYTIRAKYNATEDSIAQQVSSWTNLKEVTEGNKDALVEYLNQLKQVLAADDGAIGDFFVWDDASYENLIGKLKTADLSTDELKASVLQFFEAMSGKNNKDVQKKMDAFTASITQVEGKLKTVIQEILVSTGKFDDTEAMELASKAVNNMTGALDDYAEHVAKTSLAQQGLLRDIDHIKVKLPETSTVISQAVGQFMSLNAAITSGVNMVKIFNDETATMGEKVGSAITTLVSLSGTVTTSISQLKTASKNLKKATDMNDALAASVYGLQRALSFANLVLAGVSLGIQTYMAIQQAHYEKLQQDAEAAKEALEELQTASQKNKDMIKSMESLLETYKETGEGKEELDSVAQQLADTYDIEGAALARLSGNYEQYQKLLEEAQKRQQEELKEQTKQAEEAKENQGQILLEDARKGRIGSRSGFFGLGDQYRATFAAYTSDEQLSDLEAVKQIRNKLKEAGLLNEENKLGIQIEFDNDPDEFAKAYNKVAEIADLFKDDENAKFSITYRNMTKWLEDNKNNVDAYIETAKTAEELSLQTDTSGLLNSTTLEQYRSERSKLFEDLKNKGYYSSDAEINSEIDKIISDSTNSTVKSLKTIQDVIEDIGATGSRVSEDTIVKIWSSDAYDKMVLATLDWATLTDDTWENAYNLAKQYNDEAAKTVQILDLNTKAASALDEYYKSNSGQLSHDDLFALKDALPWGDVEAGLISFDDFLKKSYEDQKAYLQGLADFSVIPQLRNEIEAIRQQIQEVTRLKEQTELGNFWDTISPDNGDLSSFATNFDTELDKATAALENFYYRNQVVLQQYGYDSAEEFIEFFTQSYEANGKDLNKTLTSLKIKFDPSEFDKQLKQLEKKLKDKELEVKLYADTRSLDQIQSDVAKKVNSLKERIDVGIDTQDFADSVNDIMSDDYSITIKIQEELEGNLQGAVDKLEEINSAASKIGEGFLVSAGDVGVLTAQFPGILEGYQITSDGMIQLNADVAQSAINAAQQEAESAYDTALEKLKAEQSFIGAKLEAYKTIQQKLQEYLNTEVTNQEKATDLKGEIQKGLSKVVDTTNEEIYNSNKQVEEKGITSFETLAKAGDVNYESIALSAGIGYRSAADEAEKSTSRQLAAILAIVRGQEAFTTGDIPTLQGLIEYYQNLPSTGENNETQKKWIEDALKKKGITPTYDDERDTWEISVTDESGNENVIDEELQKEIEAYLQLSEETGQNIEYLQSLYDAYGEEIDSMTAQRDALSKQTRNYALGQGKNSSSSSKASEEKLTTKELEKQADVYEYINNQIEQANDLLSRQEEITSNSKSYEEKVANLREEEKTLERLNELYAEKAALSEDELAKARENLTATISGVEFDDTGLVSNVYELRQSITDQLNNKITEFNMATTEAQQDVLQTEIDAIEEEKNLWDELLDEYQEQWDNVQELIALRQTAQYDKINKALEIQFLKKDIKTLDEIQAENFDWLNSTLEVELNINKRDLDLIEYYLGKLEDDFYSMAEAAELIVSKLPSFESNMQAYETYFNQLQEQYATGDINTEDYLEGLDKAYDGILDNLKSIQDLDKEMMHYYEETLAAASEELEYYTKQMEHLTDVLEHYKNIVELVDGEYNFDAIDTILRGQATTRTNELEVLKANYEMLLRQKESIEAQMASVEAGSSAWELYERELKAITEAVIDAEDEMLEKTEEWAETMKAIMENTFAKAADEMERGMTDGMGFDRLNDSLDRLEAYQDVYLTATNERYELERLMDEAQAAADKTENKAAKEKYKSYLDQIKLLKDDGLPLSKLELEIQQARLKLIEAEIALEEAKNAKSKVRLQRDNEGNYGYVYTADSDAVSSAEQDLAAAENALYNVGLDAANDYGQRLLQLQQELSDQLQQLEEDRANGRFQTEAEYQAAKEQLIREYNDLFTAYYDQYTTALGVDLDIQEEAWITAYDDMIDKTQDWQMYTTEYTNACEDAYDQWRQAVAENNEIIQDVLNNTKEKVKEVTDASDDLKQEVVGSVIPAIESELDAVLEITAAYAAQRDQIKDLISYYEQLLERMKAIAAEESRASVQKFDVYADDYSLAMAKYLQEDPSRSINDAYYQALVNARNEKMQEDPYTQYEETAEDFYTLMYKYQKYHMKGIENELTKYVDSILAGNGYWDYPTIYSLLSRFNTGGYTGEWPGNYGKLAVLDKKELVLNADDTALFLNAAKILRQASSLINAQTAQSQTASYVPTLTTLGTSENFNQNVHIEATFPAVTDRVEIEAAFSDLINRASQYANRKII